MSFTFLSLAQMSIKSGSMIILIAIFRKIFLFHFPKRVFLSLWVIAVIRLLIPLSVSTAHILPVPLFPSWKSGQIPLAQPYLPSYPAISAGHVAPVFETAPSVPVWTILWIAGAILISLYFLVSYVISRRKFSESIAIENKDAALWLSQHPLRRGIQMRACNHIMSPLTYGIFRPTILFPMDMDFSQTDELHFVLLHEYTHIKYFHGAIKLLIVLCLCLHWFNPTVWMLYFLANKDMELFCDEMVLREHNGRANSNYARALVHMSMGSAANPHLHNSFSERTLKERIVAIMKYKKHSTFTLLLALVLAVGVTCTAFASAAPDTGLITEAGEPSPAEDDYELIVEPGEPSPAEDDYELIVEAGEPNPPEDNSEPIVEAGEPNPPENDSKPIVEYDASDNSNAGIAPHASGSLFPGDSLTYDRQTIRAGQRVTFSVSYSPYQGTVHIGIKNASTNQITYRSISGGSGSTTISVPATGQYYIFVRNPSSSVYSVNVHISYLVLA